MGARYQSKCLDSHCDRSGMSRSLRRRLIKTGMAGTPWANPSPLDVMRLMNIKTAPLAAIAASCSGAPANSHRCGRSKHTNGYVASTTARHSAERRVAHHPSKYGINATRKPGGDIANNPPLQTPTPRPPVKRKKGDQLLPIMVNSGVTDRAHPYASSPRAKWPNKIGPPPRASSMAPTTGNQCLPSWLARFAGPDISAATGT